MTWLTLVLAFIIGSICWNVLAVILRPWTSRIRDVLLWLLVSKIFMPLTRRDIKNAVTSYVRDFDFIYHTCSPGVVEHIIEWYDGKKIRHRHWTESYDSFQRLLASLTTDSAFNLITIRSCDRRQVEEIQEKCRDVVEMSKPNTFTEA
jgi:hypothetical protein